MKFLKICSNSKAINLIAVIEILAHAILHIIGSTNAKWRFLCWMIWLIILTLSRFYYFGTARFQNNR